MARAAPPSSAVTVTVVAPALSHTRLGLTLSVTNAAASSSVIVSSAVPSRPGNCSAVAFRITVSSDSRRLSSVGVNVKFAVPLVWLAGIVTVKASSAA